MKNLFQKISAVVAVILLFAAALLLSAYCWLSAMFGAVTLEQIYYHLAYPLIGVSTGLVLSVCAYMLIPFEVLLLSVFLLLKNEKQKKFIHFLNSVLYVRIAVVVVALLPLCMLLNGLFRHLLSIVSGIAIFAPLVFLFVMLIFQKYAAVRKLFSLPENKKTPIVLILGLFCFLYAVSVWEWEYDVCGSIRRFRNPSHFFEENTVAPRMEEFRFPEKKRNLVIVCIESMESTYSRADLVGEDLIPELTALRNKNLSFHDYCQITGTNWTVAALNCFFYGFPRLPLWGKMYGNALSKKVFPDSPMVLDILCRNGYNVSFMQGSPVNFAGIRQLFPDSTGLQITDYAELLKEAKYRKFVSEERSHWGIPDEQLLKIAYQHFLELADAGKPFCLMVNTLDTHSPDGYMPERCPRKYGDYRDSIRRASLLVSAFVEKLRKHPSAANTTFLLLGDHLMMDDVCGLPRNPQPGGKPCRTLYTCLINPAEGMKPVPKLYAAFDLAPTLLECIGVRWPSRRLGIGVSLFSPEQSVIGKYGIRQTDELVRSHSPYYAKLLMGNDSK